MGFLLRPGGWLILVSFIGALTLDSIALPAWLARSWPSWSALAVIYWTMTLPQRIGIGTAWLVGLGLDAAQGTLLGQHALALAVVAYLTLQTHRRIRLFPLWQQALTVLFFALVDALLVVWINGMIGYPPRDAWFLLPVVSTLLAWPLAVSVLRDLGRYYQD